MVTILILLGWTEIDVGLSVPKEKYALKDRGSLGSGDNDKEEVYMLGRKIRWHEWCLIWEGDERQRKMVIDFFGMDENSKKLMLNGCKNDEVKDATDSQEFDIQECRS